jgi:hypothetical protein
MCCSHQGRDKGGFRNVVLQRKVGANDRTFVAIDRKGLIKYHCVVAQERLSVVRLAVAGAT